MIEYNKLTYDEYKEILTSVGWKMPSERLLKISLEKGTNVKIIIDSKTIGMARFVTDGGYAGLIMDVVVIPEYQGKGYGKLLIEKLLEYIKSRGMKILNKNEKYFSNEDKLKYKECFE